MDRGQFSKNTFKQALKGNDITRGELITNEGSRYVTNGASFNGIPDGEKIKYIIEGSPVVTRKMFQFSKKKNISHISVERKNMFSVEERRIF